MDEKIIASKEQKRVSLLLSIELCTLTVANALLGIFRTKGYSALVPVNIALCGVSVVLAIVVLILIIRDHKKLTEKKRSIICCVGLFVFCGLEIWMCASTVSDINAKRNAENSAVLFIKDKYGIDAEADYRRTFSYHGESWVTVDMTADGKEFIVEQFTDTDGNTIFADSYQHDEITQAVIDEVSRVYSDGILRGIGIYNNETYSIGLFMKRFDGTNLDEVLYGNHGSIHMDFADTEFDLEAPIFKKLDAWGIMPRFTSFDTKEHLDEFVALGDIRYVSDADMRYMRYAPCITDRVIYKDGKIVRGMFDLRSQGDIQYCYVYGKNDEGFTSPGITISKNGMKNIEAECWEHRMSGYVNATVSKVYAIEGKSGTHLIYYPLEALNDVSVENIGALWISSLESYSPGVATASVCGDHAVFVLPYSATEFVLVDTTGTGGADKEI